MFGTPPGWVPPQGGYPQAGAGRIPDSGSPGPAPGGPQGPGGARKIIFRGYLIILQFGTEIAPRPQDIFQDSEVFRGFLPSPGISHPQRYLKIGVLVA